MNMSMEQSDSRDNRGGKHDEATDSVLSPHHDCNGDVDKRGYEPGHTDQAKNVDEVGIVCQECGPTAHHGRDVGRRKGRRCQHKTEHTKQVMRIDCHWALGRFCRHSGELEGMTTADTKSKTFARAFISRAEAAPWEEVAGSFSSQ